MLIDAKNLSHISLFVRDLDASIAFYRRVFGYEMWHKGSVPLPNDDTQNAFGIIGGIAIELIQLKAADTPRTREKVGISFAVDDIDATFAALKEAKITNWPAPIAALGARLVILEDPDGHFLEAIQHAPGRTSLADIGREEMAKKRAT